MRLIPLTSSQLAAVGWVETGDDPVGYYGQTVGKLGVQFQKGGFYVYEGVTERTFVDVVTDPDSQGSAFHRYVKQKGYAYHQSTAEEIASL